MRAAGEPRAGSAPRGPVAARIHLIADRLKEAYGTPEKPVLDPLDELVLTILSQNTTDTNRDRAWRSLRDAFADWEAVRRAARDGLEEAIRVAGLSRQKAAAIHGVLEALHEERGRPTLEHLEGMESDEALDYLASFRGVGVKTAACVLAFALRRPVLPVDTHVHRVGRRLGLVPAGATRDGAHDVLNRDVPPELRLPLHLSLIRLGRDRCKARRPDCGECPVADLCPRVGVGEAA